MIYLIQLKRPTLFEQTAVAEILSDMDAEITALEAKLSKARQVKQGMMSVLLTGRIRLVESENPERHRWRNHRARSETVQGAGGQGGDDVGIIDWQN